MNYILGISAVGMSFLDSCVLFLSCSCRLQSFVSGIVCGYYSKRVFWKTVVPAFCKGMLSDVLIESLFYKNLLIGFHLSIRIQVELNCLVV